MSQGETPNKETKVRPWTILDDRSRSALLRALARRKKDKTARLLNDLADAIVCLENVVGKLRDHAAGRPTRLQLTVRIEELELPLEGEDLEGLDMPLREASARAAKRLESRLAELYLRADNILKHAEV